MKLIDSLVKELPKSGGWPSEAVTAIYFRHKKGVTFYDKDGMGIKNGVSFIDMDINGVRREEVTKEEFEDALAKNDGWIEWGGGDCPVDEGEIVDLKDRDGYLWLGAEALFSTEARAEFWRHTGGQERSSDIIAYRLHRDINSRANDDRLEQDLNECIGRGVSQEWSGDGLPPVGVKCEVRVGRDNYEDCLVLYSGEHGCAFTYLGDNGDKYSIDCVSKHAAHDYFRPLRTEEEKEREKAIQELSAVICGNIPDTGMATATMYATRIYDAGYRKEEK